MATVQHPYAEIVSKFKPNEWQLEKKEPMKPKPLDDTPVTIVDSEPLLNELVGELKECREIAISVYHDKSSFRGDIGLLVFSTRSEEFVVDPMNMRNHMAVLNEIFACTDILKVMFINVANKNENRKMKLSPLQRLQKDFGLYIVNLFDLGLAAQALGERKNKSDRILLSRFVKDSFGIELGEEYVNDFTTTRPLSPEVIRFVGEETHYLLPLYDVFRNRLIEREKPWYADALMDVYKKCAASSALLWRPDDFTLDPNAYKNHLTVEKFNPTQTECFRLVHDWRWKVAEETDKQLKDVMATEYMKKIAQTLPTSSIEIAACCKDGISEVALTSIADILMLVREATKKYPTSDENKVAQNYDLKMTYSNLKTQQTKVSGIPEKDTNKQPYPPITARNTTANPTITARNATANPTITARNTAANPTITARSATANPTITPRNATANPTITARNTTANPTITARNTTANPTITAGNATANPTITAGNATANQPAQSNPAKEARNKQPTPTNTATPEQGQKENTSKDKNKQCFTCGKHGHVSKDCDSGIPWWSIGQKRGFGRPMGGRPVKDLHPGDQVGVLMSTLQGLIEGENSGRGRGRFRPYNNRGGRR